MSLRTQALPIGDDVLRNGRSCAVEVSCSGSSDGQEQDEGPHDGAFDVKQLLQTPPALDPEDEKPIDVSGIEIELEFAEDENPEDGPSLELPALDFSSQDRDWLSDAALSLPLPELDSDPHALGEQRERERMGLELGGGFAKLPPLELDDAPAGELALPLAGLIDIEALQRAGGDEVDELESPDERPAATLQVHLGESRFRASYRLPEVTSAAALYRDGLLTADINLSRVLPDGQVQELGRAPARVRQLLVHDVEGWAVLCTVDDRLYRVTEGAWQPQPITLPRNLAPGPDLHLFTIEEQPKLLAAGVLWDLVGRATHLVPDPSVQRVVRISEPSAEYAVCRSASGYNLVHLLHNSTHPTPIDFGNPRTLLASAGGRLAVHTPRGELYLMNRPGEVRQRLTLGEPVIALTMGVVAAETLVWLARLTSEGELELVEIEFSSGTAMRIFALPWGSREAWAQLLWSVSERVLYLVTRTELVALKRLEA